MNMRRVWVGGRYFYGEESGVPLASGFPSKRWIFIPAGLLFLLLFCVGYLYYRPAVYEGRLRGAILQILGERFHSDVELQELHVRLLPRLQVTGYHLSLRYHGRTDVPPLIHVASFSFSGGLLAFFRPETHISRLRVQDLQITIPPRSPADKETEPSVPQRAPHMPNIVIDRVDCEHADIRILPRQAGKVPIDWDVHNLTLTSASAVQPFQFQGSLTNGKPVGEIATKGQFGPWNGNEPAETPVSGEYEFTNANLTPLPGIGGTLSSNGRYAGVLDQLDVEGTTDTPDFSLDAVGTPVPLHTEFKATVNGTNGDTELHPVNALLAHSLIIAVGSVERMANQSGHVISIEATVPDGRIQDILKLATRSEKPILTGPVKIKAKFILPAGKERAIERIVMQGAFGVEGGNWTSPRVRDKLESLSRHAIGKPQVEDAGSAITDLRGDFLLRDGVLRFRQLTFQVEGADVELAGSYAMRPGTLDLTGHLTLQAKLSQTVTGSKSLFLKALDPFFEKKGAGTVLPIQISGTREHPVFSVKVFHKNFQRPLSSDNNKSQ
jgi:hypothetical protein